jgi:hypothetical protein
MFVKILDSRPETAMIFHLWKSPPKNKWWKSFEKCHYWQYDVSLQLSHWRQKTILTLEESYLTSSQESTCEWKQCYFLWSSRQWSTMNSLLMVRKLLILLSGSSETSVGCGTKKSTWNVDCWLLHHNNVPAHAAMSIRQFLAKHSISTLPQPPYAPYLSPPNFLYSQNSKLPLKEQDFRCGRHHH